MHNPNIKVENIENATGIMIGLEIHIELGTKTKLFCNCPRTGTEEPNTRCCPVCLGHPGSKPRTNSKAIDYALKLCLAAKCTIADRLIFSRKSYFYPDMSKNYQITQYELPLGLNGEIKVEGKTIRIKRIHLEEDPAALVHPDGMNNSKYVLIDYNRSGDPLCELVTEPDIRSPEEAREFMKTLMSILEYLEIIDEHSIVKADVNVSVRETNYRRVEIKNINGIKEIEDALKYEISRQRENVSEVVLETRTWNAEKSITTSMRKKESEEEYGYILDTDLVPIDISEEYVSMTKKELPELAEEKASRLVQELGVDIEDSKVLCQDKNLARIFEDIASKVNPIIAARWIRKDLVKALNVHGLDIKSFERVDRFIELLSLISEKKITDPIGREILDRIMLEDFSPREYVKEKGIEAVHDEDEIEKYCIDAINESSDAVADYKNGKEKAMQAIVGKVMKMSRGKANPAIVSEKIRKIIK